LQFAKVAELLDLAWLPRFLSNNSLVKAAGRPLGKYFHSGALGF